MPFDSPLELRHRPGHNRWEVVRPMGYLRCLPARASLGGYQPDHIQRIEVPAGYLSDLASVPRLARRLVDPQAPNMRRPSVLHDYLYTHQTHRFTKAEADQIFYEALLEEGMGQLLAWLMWQAVRLGGRGNWGKP